MRTSSGRLAFVQFAQFRQPIRNPDAHRDRHVGGDGDGDLVHATLRAIQSFGMMMGDVERSIEDGRVTPNELRKVERAMLDAVAHVSGLHRLLAHQAGGR